MLPGLALTIVVYNQDLLPSLGAGLHPNTGFEPRVINRPDGRVGPGAKLRANWQRRTISRMLVVRRRVVTRRGHPSSRRRSHQGKQQLGVHAVVVQGQGSNTGECSRCYCSQVMGGVK